MTTHLMTMLVLGIGIGACLGWMLGVIAGRQSVLRDAPSRLDAAIAEEATPEPPLTARKRSWPAAPDPTDWEDFEQRTDREHMYGVPRFGYGGRY